MRTTLNLYTRLKKDDFILINDYKKKYPALGKLIIDALKNTQYFYSLSLADVTTLNEIFFNSHNKIDVYNLHDKFNN